MCLKIVLILFIVNIAIIKSDISFISYVIINQCQGKDAGNYTIVETSSMDDQCVTDLTTGNSFTFIQTQSNGTKTIYGAVLLAESNFPSAGVYKQTERLILVTSGPLAGKYLFEKIIVSTSSFLKKCSSTLGYSYIMTKSLSFLIGDTLDLNVLISPTGGYELFKKGCTTICSGQGYIM